MIMICQKCGKRNATVHLKQVINGVAKEEFLCSLCAGEGGSFFSTSDIGSESLFDALFSGGAHTSAATRKSCPLCGSTARDIQKSGKAGCAKCYEVFRGELSAAAYRVHGGVHHVGRAPGKHKEEMERQAKLDELKSRQAKAIDEQDFELAAKLRDEIKAIVNGETGDAEGKGEN